MKNLAASFYWQVAGWKALAKTSVLVLLDLSVAFDTQLVCTVWPGSSAEALSVLAEAIYGSHCFYTDVPQGSVFGPASLLYSIQIYSPRIFYTLYADDISLSVLSPEWLTCLTYFCRAPWHFTLAREKHLLRFLVFSDRESIQNMIRQLHWLPPQVCYHSHPVEL